MTAPRPHLRIADIAPEHAELLKRIHHLAGHGAQLRHTIRDTHSDFTQTTRMLSEPDAVERERAVTEITARGNGVPATWINHVRRSAQIGRDWSNHAQLPTPAGQPARRRSTRRVDADLQQLTDIAALSVTRSHLLTTHGIPTEPEPAAAHQLHRNTAALWSRATKTATAIGMSGAERTLVFSRADARLHQRLDQYRHQQVDTLTDLWHAYTTPSIAAGVRRSLASLRRTRDPRPDPNAPLPATPDELLDRARRILAANHDDSEIPSAIATAVSAALPQPPHRRPATTPEAHNGSDESAVTAPSTDTGPDP